MTPTAYALWFVVLLLLLWLAWTYNRLVAARNAVKEGWSGIDVQLKRRHDLVPMLVDAVGAYARHERGLLERVARLRGRGAPDLEEEAELSRELERLLAVAEAYPELKASANFLGLQRQLVEVEEALQMARRYYNGAVRVYNTLLESFPTLLVARRFSFTPARYFELPLATEARAPEVKW
ncbi:LemA family protein [Deinococcota bacterium DY0809b]